jgi:hypothetical protein
MKKIVTGILVAAIVSATALGIITRGSYVDGYANSMDFDSYRFYQRKEAYPFEEADVFDHLDAAYTILKVRFSGEREQAYLCTRSKVSVVSVYKGDDSLLNTDIIVYEMPYFGPYLHDCRNFALFNLMQNGLEYYVFLREKQYLAPYQERLGIREFRSMGDFSIIDVNSTVPRSIDSSKDKTFADIKTIPFFSSSEAETRTIVAIKQRIVERYELK